jgi:hypothetical protein
MRAYFCSVLLVSVVFVGCGSSSSTENTSRATTPPSQTQSAAQQTKSPPTPKKYDSAQEAENKINAEAKANNPEAQPYSGLGATKEAFKAHNNVTEHQPPSEPAEGTDEDAIEAVNSANRVTKYERTFHFNPPPSSAERLRLVDGIDLPGYPSTVHETDTCMVWRSPILKQLIGKEYAQATTAPESTSVMMEAVAHPSC